MSKHEMETGAVENRWPLKEPHTASIQGFSANFWIHNRVDWHRIVRGSEFENMFAEELIGTIAETKGIFLDVGSAQGLYTILGAKAGASRVIAVDPDPISNISLSRNIDLNPDIKPKIRRLPIALGSANGEMSLHFDSQGRHAPSFELTYPALEEETVVKVRSLDSLLLNKETPSPVIAKVDVEGAEGLVLDGMSNVLQSADRPRHIFIELHEKYLPQFGESIDSIMGRLLGQGYSLLKDPSRRGNVLHCHYIPIMS